MVEQRTERRLAAILAADVVGYSRLLGADEAGTLARLRALRRDIVDPMMAEHDGRVFKTTGDGLLAEFPSAVQALRCAIAIQDRARADADALQLRIGLHQGDVVVEGDDLLGDGVNIAARIEGLAEAGGVAISARVREDAAGKMALDVEDLGEPELKNIAQKIRIFRVRPRPSESGASDRPAPPLPDQPSLVVLPFQNMSGDPEQEYFADGIVADITAALSRIVGVAVTARNVAFSYKGRAVDVQQVGRELGVRYALEGSVRRAGGRVRITCRLIEAATGAHVWDERFDDDLADGFALQDRVTESVAAAIEPCLLRAEIARASAQALEQYYLFDQAGTWEAMRLLRRAIAMNGRVGLAKALAAYCVALASEQTWIALDDRRTVEAAALARSALAQANDDPSILALAGFFVGLVERDFDTARAALDRAVALNPNSASILGHSGWLKSWLGEFDVARGQFSLAMQLSPLDPNLHILQSGLARALVLGEPRDPLRALDLVRQALLARPNSFSILLGRTYCLVELRRMDEARETVQQILAIRPNTTIAQLRRLSPFRAAVVDRMVDLLRQAGYPE